MLYLDYNKLLDSPVHWRVYTYGVGRNIMYQIGNFSRITQLSVKTLRYYDEIGILTPSNRDEQTNYRYYDDQDFERAQMIKLLRSLEFSIMEIQDLFQTIHSSDDLSYYIREKQDFILKEIAQQEKVLQRMEHYLQQVEKSQAAPAYEITEVKLPQLLVASYEYTGNYKEISKYLPIMYKEIKGNVAQGHTFNLYYDESYQEEAHIEICIPIKKKFVSKQCNIKVLPELTGIATLHQGSYEALNLAYKNILDYAFQHHLELITPSRELYIKGPGKIFKGNPNTYQTQIILPIKEK